MHRAVSALLLATALSFPCARPTRAQQAAEEAPPAEYITLIQDAVTESAAERWVEARSLFREAQKDFSGRVPCASTADCEPGSLCLRAPALDSMGICVWPCSPGGLCPPNATCEAIPTPIGSLSMNPMHACLATCINAPGSCGPLTCAAFPTATQHCTPAGWL